MKNLILFISILSLLSCNQQTKSTDKIDPNSSATDTLNIDPVKILPDKFKVLLENQHVRVVEYSLNPGEKDEWHTHPPKSSYVVSGGKLKVYLENGETIIADEIAGTASWSDYVGKHYVENIGSTKVTIVLTEVKQ